jgi:hypothetical protein
MPPAQKDECSASNTILKAIGRRNRRKWRLVPTLTFINWQREPGFQPVPDAPWLSLERSWGGRLVNITVRYYALRLDFRYDWIAEMTEAHSP